MSSGNIVPDGKRSWRCPGCNQEYWIRRDSYPTLCPDCRKADITKRPLANSSPANPSAEPQSDPLREAGDRTGKSGSGALSKPIPPVLVALLSLGVVGGAAFLLCCGGLANTDPDPVVSETPLQNREISSEVGGSTAMQVDTPTKTTTPTPSTGDVVRLVPSEYGWAAAVDDAAWDAMNQAANAGDQVGWRKLLASGRMFILQPGTRVRVLEVGFFSYKIRAEDGPHVGRAGWIVKEALGGFE